jgi:hypothetical protein
MENGMVSFLRRVGVATILAFAMSLSAHAQVAGYVDTGLANGTITIPSSGGWKIQISGCAAAVTKCSADTLTASVAGSTLSLVFSGTNNGNDFLYNNGAGLMDLGLILLVTAPAGENIWYASDTLGAGTNTTGNAGFVSASETLTGATQLMSTLNASPLLQSEAFTPVASTTAGLDFKPGKSTATTVVPTVTLTFNAPEPVSSSLLMVGVAGLGFVRSGFVRRKIRRTK